MELLNELAVSVDVERVDDTAVFVDVVLVYDTAVSVDVDDTEVWGETVVSEEVVTSVPDVMPELRLLESNEALVLETIDVEAEFWDEAGLEVGTLLEDETLPEVVASPLEIVVELRTLEPDETLVLELRDVEAENDVEVRVEVVKTLESEPPPEVVVLPMEFVAELGLDMGTVEPEVADDIEPESIPVLEV